ncbi:putative phospholipase a2 [Diaporthe ampelina]|uniref:Putative phospholipase a2 n=1 Tax=Diaporthe ampelina TaxID=1214573 RepID=A0A0G2HNN8_9PEZI|nr:putative phospholipase a2 [Diaporthe ampelina]
MKVSSIACVAWLVPATFALGPVPLSPRQDIQTVTDSYLFDISLAQFITYRDAQNPSTLDWTSDGCSDSPDNPLGFNFEPACYRHDFGYTNYRAQSRFTKAAKASIDTNFQEDLKFQCESESFESICDALADVYYTAVKLFGGQDATKRADSEDVDADALAEYEHAVAVYEQLVAEAKANGEIPA